MTTTRERLKKYGLTHTELVELEVRQGGVCAICRQPETLAHHDTGTIKSLSIDHCHETGMVRGLLCNACNRLLGLVKDDILWLESARDYLVSPPAQEHG